MNKWIKGLLISSIVCGALGGLLYLSVYLTTKEDPVTDIESYFDYSIHQAFRGHHHNYGGNSNNNGNDNRNNLVINQEYSIEEIYDNLDSLIIDVSNADLSVRTDIDDKVRLFITTFTHDHTRVSMNNGILSIIDDCESECKNHYKSDKIILWIPQDTVIKDSTINITNGKINLQSVECENVKFDLVNVEIDATNTSLDNVIVNNVNGDFEYSGTVTNELSINLVNGDVDLELKHRLEEISYTLSNMNKEISINDVEVKRDFNDIVESIKIDSICNIKVDCVNGEIELETLK